MIIADEITALPKMPTERTYWSAFAHGHKEFSGAYVAAIEARLALAEKLLIMLCRDVDWYMLPSLTAEARAYLAFREKE